MAGLTGHFSLNVTSGGGITGRIYWVETTEESSNTSSVKAYFQVSKSSSSVTTYGTFSGYITIDGNKGSWSGSVSVPPGASNQTIFTVTKTVAHATDGSANGIAVRADGQISGTSWTDSLTNDTIDLTDFVRTPSQPSGAPTFTRVSPGTTIGITSASVTSPLPVTRYEYQQSTTISFTGATAVSMGTSLTANITVANGTQTYYYQTRAVNADGNGAWSATGSTAGISGDVTAYNVPTQAFLTIPYAGQVSFSNSGVFAVETPYGSPGGTSGLPTGLSINTSTGAITGTPATIGSYFFRVSLNGNVYAPSSTTNYNIIVGNAGPKVVTGTSPLATTRSSLKVRDAGTWVNAYMRVYDDTYTNPDDGSHWRQIT
jgi:hypothetical protein